MFQRQFSLQISLTEQENNISNTIHPTAIIDKTSFIGKNVRIGPYSIIEKNVKIDDECIIGNNVTICSNTELGKNCKVFHSSSIGEIPQDLKFSGEETKTIVGDGTTIREYVTVNRGTKALGQTKIGAGCLLMASSHVAHDCILGDNIIMSNLCTLGGHVELGDWVVLGGGVLVHQFTKIEQIIISLPEKSWEYHEDMLENCIDLWNSLNIHYRVVNICTGDMGTVASKKYDLEAWLPGPNEFKEIVSCSNCTDYQANRLKMRYRTAEGNSTVHTLNSTAVATSRALVAIMEQNQLEDGRIKIPEVLQPYMNGQKILQPAPF